MLTLPPVERFWRPSLFGEGGRLEDHGWAGLTVRGGETRAVLRGPEPHEVRGATPGGGPSLTRLSRAGNVITVQTFPPPLMSPFVVPMWGDAFVALPPST